MKNAIKLFGIIAIVAVIGFSMAACGDGGGGGGGDKNLTGTITINPSGSVEIGTKLTATYSGTESVSFQWKKDSSNIGTSSKTNPNEYTPTTAGSYTVTVSAEGYKSKTSAAVTTDLPDAISLTKDEWADGELASSGDVNWFKFTASATTQYILFKAGTLSNVYVQLYDEDGRKVGDRTQLSAASSPLSRTVTIGDCYINVTTSYSTGTYQIAYSGNFTPAGTVTDLSVGTAWIDATMPSSGEQWFKYVASADAALYIHFKAGTGTGALTYAYAQIYEDAASVGNSVSLSNSNSSPLTVTNEKMYYIKVSRSSGTNTLYKIALTTSPMPPDATPTDITVGVWQDSTMPTGGGQQWFKFTATSDTQYIHLSPGDLTGADVQLYDVTTGAAVGETKYLSGSTLYVSRTVTSGKAYYIKVIPFITTGTYKIGVTASTTPPTTP